MNIKDNLTKDVRFNEGDKVVWTSRSRHGYENKHPAIVVRQSGQRVKIKIPLDPILPEKFYTTYVKPQNLSHAS